MTSVSWLPSLAEWRVADHVERAVGDAGVRAVGGSRGHREFVAGKREVILRETVVAIAGLL